MSSTESDPRQEPGSSAHREAGNGARDGHAAELEALHRLAAVAKDEARLLLLRLGAEVRQRSLGLLVVALAGLALVVAVPMAVGLLLRGLSRTLEQWVDPGMAQLLTALAVLTGIGLLVSLLRRRIFRRFRSELDRALESRRRQQQRGQAAAEGATSHG